MEKGTYDLEPLAPPPQALRPKRPAVLRGTPSHPTDMTPAEVREARRRKIHVDGTSDEPPKSQLREDGLGNSYVSDKRKSAVLRAKSDTDLAGSARAENTELHQGFRKWRNIIVASVLGLVTSLGGLWFIRAGQKLDTSRYQPQSGVILYDKDPEIGAMRNYYVTLEDGILGAVRLRQGYESNQYGIYIGKADDIAIADHMPYWHDRLPALQQQLQNFPLSTEFKPGDAKRLAVLRVLIQEIKSTDPAAEDPPPPLNENSDPENTGTRAGEPNGNPALAQQRSRGGR